MSDDGFPLAAWLRAHTDWLVAMGVEHYPPGEFRGADLGVARYPVLRTIPDAETLYGAAHAHGYADAYQELREVLSGPEARGRELEALNLMVIEGMPHREVTRKFHEEAKASPERVTPLRVVDGRPPDDAA